MTWWKKGPKEDVLEDWARLRAAELGGILAKLPPLAGEKHRPDRVLLHPAHPAAFLELKRRGEEPSPEQAFTLERLRQQGYVAGWAATREQVEAFLQLVLGPSQPGNALYLSYWQRIMDLERERYAKLLTGRGRRGPVHGGAGSGGGAAGGADGGGGKA